MNFSRIKAPSRRAPAGLFGLRSRRLALCLLLGGFPVFAKDDPLQLLKRHRYGEAYAAWQKEAQGPKADEKMLRALKGQALSSARLGSLYREFQRFSQVLAADYYREVAEANSSPWVLLYLGQAQFYAGQYPAAQASLEKARKAGARNPALVEMSEVFLHFSRQRAAGGKAPYGGALTDNAAQWQALELRAAPFSEARNLAVSGPRARRCRLSLYLNQPNPNQAELEKMLAQVAADGEKPETFQDEGKTTQLNFYDPRVLGALSEGHYALALLLNRRLQQEEGRFPQLASKFGTRVALGEAALMMGDAREAEGLLGADSSTDGRILRAQIWASQGRKKEAADHLDALLAKTKSSAVKREAANTHYLFGLDLNRGLQLAREAAREKGGAAAFRTYGALLAAKGEMESALQQYARGYKPEYRNRIDQIDPEYISEYAFVIYRNNKLRYEEVVETLYHIQKEFPACRQMHYSMQGLSASLARSAETQNIFRKGG